MFDRIFSVFDKDGRIVANFPNYKDAYSLAKKFNHAHPDKLIQDAPLFMSWATLDRFNEEEEEAERQAFAEMLRSFREADDE